jgi:hypothetical protein
VEEQPDERATGAAAAVGGTTMTLKWIAAELHMGTWTHVSNLVNRKATKGKATQ